jgi:hypothetical protein
MCHIDRDGEENEMRMHKSISQKEKSEVAASGEEKKKKGRKKEKG